MSYMLGFINDSHIDGVIRLGKTNKEGRPPLIVLKEKTQRQLFKDVGKHEEAADAFNKVIIAHTLRSKWKR